MGETTNLQIVLLISVFLIATTCSIAAGKIIYVDDDAYGLNDGTSWTNAYNDLQDALTVAVFGDEIRVAQGIYKPDEDSAHPSGSSDRRSTFQLRSNVTVKGGYAGAGEPDTNARDIEVYETILSGDIGLLGNSIDNSYNVVTGSGCDKTAVLDGFTVTSGNANGPYPYYCGGGMFNLSGSPSVINCIFTDNSTRIDGGGVWNGDGSPSFTNCTFRANWAERLGGGMKNNRVGSTITNCIFRDNHASTGGGMTNSSSNLVITGCTFEGNTGTSGGGMCNRSDVTGNSTVLIDCNFISNSAHSGAGMNNNSSNPVLYNCCFLSNIADNNGGGMSNSNSSPFMINCIFTGNAANGHLGGGAMKNYKASPRLINCIVTNNSAANMGGGISNSNSSLAIINCTFAGNSALNGNALACDLQGNPSNLQITNSILWDGGDEIWNNDESTITITYSDVQGGWPGEGNIDTDPCFVEPGYWDPGDMWIEGDYHLMAGSACIDVGDNSAIPPSVITDLEGYPRIRGPAVDMGAYESPLVLFVDADAVGANNGSCWADAYNYLHYALAVAQSRDEIRVAQGIYKPTKGSVRSISFELLNGVAIYGGFPPGGGTWFERNPSTYETILSGDLFGNDGPNFTNNGDNSYHVVTGSSCDQTAVLDGFTITAGNANGNYPNYYGGGIYIGKGSSPTIINCTFTQNSAHSAGGLYIGENNSSMIINCTFIQNSAEWGGAIWNYFGSPTLINCMFIGNSTDFGHGGAIHNYTHGNLTVTNCTFSNNTAESRAGGINSSYSTLTMNNCILWGNTDARGMGESAQISSDYGKLPGIINYCCIQGWMGTLGGIGNMGDDPLFVDVTIDNYHLLPGSPCIDAGDPNYIAEPNEMDLDGNPRVIGSRIDMGAYEFQNTPPVADAGPDQVVECACNTEEGTKVILDGTGSYDADGDSLTYTWTGPFVESPVHGDTPTVTLEAGCPDDYVITLVVNDGMEDSEPDEVTITVVDTKPPDFEFSVEPTMLWPPDHKMVKITPSWTVSDECDATPDVSLVSIVANEGDDTIGDGHTSNDIQIGEDGSIYLRSERSGTSNDRIYTITYQAVDDCGNTTVRSATVSIPHDFKVLARIASRWLWTNPAGRIPEDLNGDGIVNFADFAKFAENWIK